jgi:hypothetical protein
LVPRFPVLVAVALDKSAVTEVGVLRERVETAFK